jgi:hypothetical protein
VQAIGEGRQALRLDTEHGPSERIQETEKRGVKIHETEERWQDALSREQLYREEAETLSKMWIEVDGWNSEQLTRRSRFIEGIRSEIDARRAEFATAALFPREQRPVCQRYSHRSCCVSAE